MLRVLCREDFSIQSAKMFAVDLKMAIEWLDAHFIYNKEQACLDEGRHMIPHMVLLRVLSVRPRMPKPCLCHGMPGYKALQFCITRVRALLLCMASSAVPWFD